LYDDDDDDDGCGDDKINYRTTRSKAHAGCKWWKSTSAELTYINLSQSAVGYVVITSGIIVMIR
jgi:hypothetical protein